MVVVIRIRNTHVEKRNIQTYIFSNILPFLSPSFPSYGVARHGAYQAPYYPQRNGQGGRCIACPPDPPSFVSTVLAFSYRNRMHSLIESDRDLEGTRSIRAVNPLALSREGDGGRAIHRHHILPSLTIKPPCMGSSFSLLPKVAEDQRP